MSAAALFSPIVIVNGSGGRAKKAGAAALANELVAGFAGYHCAVSPQIVRSSDIAGAIAEAKAARVVAIGGGDGTLGLAAGLLAKSGQIMAVLPLGTLNHLSVDLEIPLDLNKAIAIALGGRAQPIDLGQAGETVFVNNASIGLYTRLVRNRDKSRLPKWLATLPAAWTVLRALRDRRIEIDIDGARSTISTPLLFIGNNRYNYRGDRVGRRDSLIDGQLSVYAVRPRTPAGLIGFALRALIGRADPMRDFLAIREVTAFSVLGTGMIDVAHDGEVSQMALPLTFRSLPGALQVMMPPKRPE